MRTTRGKKIEIGFRETGRSRRSRKKVKRFCSCRVISPSSTMTTCLLNGIEKELNAERVFGAATGRDKYFKKKCAVC